MRVIYIHIWILCIQMVVLRTFVPRDGRIETIVCDYVK